MKKFLLPFLLLLASLAFGQTSPVLADRVTGALVAPANFSLPLPTSPTFAGLTVTSTATLGGNTGIVWNDYTADTTASVMIGRQGQGLTTGSSLLVVVPTNHWEGGLGILGTYSGTTTTISINAYGSKDYTYTGNLQFNVSANAGSALLYPVLGLNYLQATITDSLVVTSSVSAASFTTSGNITGGSFGSNTDIVWGTYSGVPTSGAVTVGNPTYGSSGSSLLIEEATGSSGGNWPGGLGFDGTYSTNVATMSMTALGSKNYNFYSSINFNVTNNVISGANPGIQTILTLNPSPLGASVFSQSLSVAGVFTSTGAATMASTLNVLGSSTYASIFGTSISDSGTLSVSGASTIGTLTLTSGTVSTALINVGTLSQSGVATFGGAVVGSGSFQIYGTTTVTGSSTFASTLTVTGASTLATESNTLLTVGASGSAFKQIILLTVSPSSGTATLTNSAITATTSPLITMLTAAGTVTTSSYNPQMHAGSMSFTVGTLDTSTYSVLLLVR